MSILDALDALQEARDARDAAEWRAVQEVRRQYAGIIERRLQELSDAVRRATEKPV